MYNAWIDARTAYEGIGVSQQLVTSAQEAVQLAQACYQAGTSSIMELSQAEVQQITGAMARFDHQIRRRALDFQTGELK